MALACALVTTACGVHGVACTATSLSGGDEPADGGATDAGDPRLTGLVGSYDLALETLGVHGRLDLRIGAEGTVEALVTLEGNVPAAFPTTVSDGSLVLGDPTAERFPRPGAPIGPAVFRARDLSFLTDFTLTRDASGALAGAVTARGYRESVTDSNSYSPFDATGSVTRDERAPTIGPVSLFRLAPEGSFLPWDTFTIRVDEPVAPATLRAGTSAATAEGALLALTLDPLPAEEGRDLWSGTTGLTARLVNPFAAAGGGATLNLAAGAGTAPEGPASPSRVLPLPVMRLGAPRAVFGFDDAATIPTTWGATFWNARDAGDRDSRCETGGCVALGPYDIHACRGKRAGVTGMLTRGASGKVVVRLRTLVRDANGYGHRTPEQRARSRVVPQLDLVTEDGAVTTTYLATTGLSELDAPLDGYPFTSPWTTVEVPLPPGAGPVAFALALPVPPKSPTDVCDWDKFFESAAVVDSIAAP